MSYRAWVDGLAVDCTSAADLIALIDRTDGPLRVERVGGLYRSTVPAVTASLFQRWCRDRAAEADQFFALSTSGAARRLARRAHDALRALGTEV